MTKRLFEAAMHAGDIILTTDRRSFVSTIIRSATGAEFSHTAIYVGGRIIEARGMGVASVSLDRLYIEDPRNVAVLRHRDREGARRAAQQAYVFLGHRYHYTGALLSAVRRRPWLLVPATFCSALVGEAYRRAGIELFDGVDPRTASPGDFLRSQYLEDVTHDVVRDISEVRVSGQTSIDAGAANKYSEVILRAQHRTFSKPLNFVLKVLGHDHRSIEEAILTIHNSSGWRQFIKDRALSGAVRVGGLAGAWNSVLNEVQSMIDEVDLASVMASIDSEGAGPICTDAEIRKIRECRDMTEQLIQTDKLRESYVESLHAQGDGSLQCLPALQSVLGARRAKAAELLAKLDGMLRDIEHLRARRS